MSNDIRLYLFSKVSWLKRNQYIYELLNRMSSRIVQVAAASGLAQEFRIVLPPKVKIKSNTSSVYSSLYGILIIFPAVIFLVTI